MNFKNEKKNAQTELDLVENLKTTLENMLELSNINHSYESQSQIV